MAISWFGAWVERSVRRVLEVLPVFFCSRRFLLSLRALLASTLDAVRLGKAAGSFNDFRGHCS